MQQPANLWSARINSDNGGKKIFLDLNENEYGSYLKISECLPQGNRRTIVARHAFVELLQSFINACVDGFYEKNGINEGVGILATKYILTFNPKKKFVVQLVQNTRGRAIKITETATNHNKQCVIIPESSFLQIKRSLIEMYSMYPSFRETDIQVTDGKSDGNRVLCSKIMKYQRDTFFFDYSENEKGKYLKLSRSSASNRSTVLLPVELLIPMNNLCVNIMQKRFQSTIEQFDVLSLSDPKPSPPFAMQGQVIDRHCCRNVHDKDFCFEFAITGTGTVWVIYERCNSQKRCKYVCIPEACLQEFHSILCALLMISTTTI